MLLPATSVLLFCVLWALFFVTGPFFERLLARVANRTASLRYGDYLSVVAVVVIGAGLTALVGDQFLDLAELVQTRSPQVERADSGAHAWAATARTPGATAFFTVMTIIGNPPVLALLAVVLSVIVVRLGHWRWAVYLMSTGIIGGLLNLQLKSFFARARPDLAEALRQAHGYSFPSGHAMGSMVVLGAAGYVLFRLFRSWKARSAAIAGMTTLIVSIAFSRVYLGVHWVSDVAAGIAAGFVWFVTATLAYETFRRVRRVRAMRRARTTRS